MANEIDAHLHPLLTKHLVMLFNNSDTNPNGHSLFLLLIILICLI